jgi:tetratricopeptide (TPR) repeat protein/energy-coupling factor transporter ATP-binding protein EcfA2
VILITFGGLQLSGADFGRLKPLLLLAYLAIGGRRDRKHLATLFFPKNADRLNNLSITLSRLRKAAPGIIEADETRVWTNVNTDVQQLLTALENHDLKTALGHYQGMFLEGVNIDDCGEELELWMFEQRELLAGHMRRLYLVNAEQEASRGNFETASQYAETAYLFPGAPEPELEDLRRLYPLLLVGGSPETAHVRQEAETFGLKLQSNLETIRSQYQPVLLGRERELERLRALREGEWAWVRGGSGMGKTTLLKTMSGHQLMARAGLPYATLEPFVGTALSDGEEAMLRMLAKLQGVLLIDGWHQMDVESQNVLQRLRQLRPSLKVVVASRDAPPFEVEHLLELTTINPDALTVHAGAWEATGGVPALVGAYLRGEPLVTAFEARLNNLSATAREVCFALALLEEPDLVLVRRALELNASIMASAVNELIIASLIESSGHIKIKQSILEYLESRDTLSTRLSLKLARQKEGVKAFLLYQRAQIVWESTDFTSIAQAYIAWARELLRRGFPMQAANLFDEIPESVKNPETILLQAKCLERAGHYLEALDKVLKLEKSPDILALKSNLSWRLGHLEEARVAALEALKGDMITRAEALDILGNISLSKETYSEALDYFQRSAALFLALGEKMRYGDLLNSIAIIKVQMGEDVEKAFSEAVRVSVDNPLVNCRIKNNIGLIFQKNGSYDLAEHMYLESIDFANKASSLDGIARAWLNLGALYFDQSKIKEAKIAYENAINYAQMAGEKLIVALSMANLAEITKDVGAIQEAMRILHKIGYDQLAERVHLEIFSKFDFVMN